MEAMLDPYAYRDGIVVPKLIVTGTNDAYWPLDAGELYLDDLEGETFTLNVPNAGHGLESGIDRVVRRPTRPVFVCRRAYRPPDTGLGSQ